MKTCGRCKETKSKEFFRKRSASKDGLSSWCRQCFAEYDRERWANGDKKRKQLNREKFTARNQNLLWSYLEENGCVDCPERDPIILEFDHRDSTEKSYNICEMLKSFSWEKILEEINKCDVRCCNCHRRKTTKQLEWWRGQRDMV